MGLIQIDLFTTLDGVAQAPGGPQDARIDARERMCDVCGEAAEREIVLRQWLFPAARAGVVIEEPSHSAISGWRCTDATPP